MTADVNDLLRWLDEAELGEAEMVYHPELNRRLDPYRSTHPLPFICAGARCKTTIAAWAMAGGSARVLPGPGRKPRRDDIAGAHPTAETEEDWLSGTVTAGTVIVGGDADLVFPDFDNEQRFEQPIEWAINGDGAIRLDANPEVGAGWPLRWKFTCPRCERSYQYTNRAMLGMFLGAINARRDCIRPGKIP